MVYDEPVPNEWDLAEESPEELESPKWRRRLIIAVAVVTVIAMTALPLNNLIERGQPPVADNGLEICGFDYCIVQDGLSNAGLDLAMTRLANTYLDDVEAEQLAGDLLGHLNEDPVNFVMVNRLDRQITGQYVPATRTVLVERPARAWIVVHEMAHTVAAGHGEDFQSALIELTRWLEARSTELGL